MQGVCKYSSMHRVALNGCLVNYAKCTSASWRGREVIEIVELVIAVQNAFLYRQSMSIEATPLTGPVSDDIAFQPHALIVHDVLMDCTCIYLQCTLVSLH